MGGLTLVLFGQQSTAAHAPAHSHPGPGPRTTSEPRVQRGSDRCFLTLAPPGLCGPGSASRLGGRGTRCPSLQRSGGGGRAGRPEGDPSPKVTAGGAVPPGPATSKLSALRALPAADLQVRRALSALPGCRGHLPGSALPSALARGCIGLVASRATTPPPPPSGVLASPSLRHRLHSSLRDTM